MDMTLYEIGQAYQYFLEQVEAGEVPEEAINDTLSGIEGDFKEKADNLACMIKNLQYFVDIIKAEEKVLSARRKSKESQIQWLKDYLMCSLLEIGQSRMETARNMISIRKTKASVHIEDTRNFIEWAQENEDSLLTYHDPDPNKTRIKEYLDAGGEIPGVSMEQGQTLQIRKGKLE